MSPYVTDLIIQMEGLMNGYFKWMVMDDMHISGNQLGAYLVRRMDDVAAGMRRQGEAPLIKEEAIPAMYQGEQAIQDILFSMKSTIDSVKLPEEKTEQLHEAMAVLLEETGKEHPQPVLVQSLLVHFQRIPELRNDCEKIAHLMHIDLLE